MSHIDRFFRYILHDDTVRCWPARPAIFVVARALVFLPPSPVIEVEIIHEPIVKCVVPVIYHWSIAHHGWRRRTRARESMVVSIVVHRHHGTRCKSRTSPTTRHHVHWCISPLPRYCIATSNMTSNQLVASPRSLHHLNGLSIREASVARWASVGRCNQGLVSLAIRTTEEVGKEAAWLAHGDPRVTAGGRVVESATAHPVEQGQEKWA